MPYAEYILTASMAAVNPTSKRTVLDNMDIDDVIVQIAILFTDERIDYSTMDAMTMGRRRGTTRVDSDDVDASCTEWSLCCILSC